MCTCESLGSEKFFDETLLVGGENRIAYRKGQFRPEFSMNSYLKRLSLTSSLLSVSGLHGTRHGQDAGSRGGPTLCVCVCVSILSGNQTTHFISLVNLNSAWSI